MDFVFRLFSSGIRFGTENLELCTHYCYYQTLNWVHHSADFSSQNALKLTYARSWFQKFSWGWHPRTPVGGLDRVNLCSSTISLKKHWLQLAKKILSWQILHFSPSNKMTSIRPCAYQTCRRAYSTTKRCKNTPGQCSPHQSLVPRVTFSARTRPACFQLFLSQFSLFKKHID